MNHLDQYMQRLEKEHKEFDEGISTSRKISRNLIYKIVVLSASIVGFSVSLLSIEVLSPKINIEYIKYSWYALLMVIIMGLLVMLLDGRFGHAVTWKSFQVSEYPDPREKFRYSLKEKVLANLVTFITVFHPTNMLFNKGEPSNLKSKVNGLVVIKLAKWKNRIPLFENLCFLLFILALILLVKSFNF